MRPRAGHNDGLRTHDIVAVWPRGAKGIASERLPGRLSRTGGVPSQRATTCAPSRLFAQPSMTASRLATTLWRICCKRWVASRMRTRCDDDALSWNDLEG